MKITNKAILLKRVLIGMMTFTLFLVFQSCGSDNCDGKFDKDYKVIADKDTAISNLNVFIENSGSIDGYVNDKMSTFKSSIFNIANNIDNNLMGGDTAKLNLFYINNKIIPYGMRDLKGFILDLSPEAFKSRGGDRLSTDMASVIDAVMKHTDVNKGEVSILISDFIFSPPEGSTDDYLSMQKGQITNSCMAKMKDTPELSIEILKLSSFFNGKWVKTQRPFYMMIIGSRANVAQIKGLATNVESAYSDFKPRAVKYAITDKGKIGTFEFCQNSKHRHIIQCGRKEMKGKKTFGFSIGVDLSGIPLSEDYLSNLSNYTISSGKYKITKVEKAPENEKVYTHYIFMEYTGKGDIHSTSLEIKINRNVPAWVNITNTDSADSFVAGKTYGIKSLFSGIKDAFDKAIGDKKDESIKFKGENCFTKFRIFIDE
jgi:hypothetical protein